MELRHLRYFLAVAEELHFHRAATRLHISQPPLSQQIRALERELGVTLLERNRRRVTLTAAGEGFRDDVRTILAAVERASERARHVARGSLGTLSIGFVGSAMFSPTLPDILREFRAGHPDVELVLRELPTTAQLSALVGGELDVGVIRGPGGGVRDRSPARADDDPARTPGRSAAGRPPTRRAASPARRTTCAARRS